MLKRKRSFKKYVPRKRRRYSQRKRYRTALKTVSRALETKKRFFSEELEFAPGDRYIYDPLQYVAQNVYDNGINGNSMFLKGLMIRGKVVAYPGPAGAGYAGPLTMYIYLIRARDEVNTGSVAEGFTSAPTTVNSWFAGTSSPSTWYVNTSKCTILKRKKIELLPDISNGFNNVGPQYNRAPYAAKFFVKKRILRKHMFQETTGGVTNIYSKGKWYNYYWLFCFDQALGYSDIDARVNYCTHTTWKEI